MDARIDLPPESEAAQQSGAAVARVVLKPRRAQPFFGRHPWVFEGAIQYIDGACADGDIVDLLTDKGKFIARGLINTRSKLHVRLYSWDSSQPLDAGFWRGRLARAVELRSQLGRWQLDGAMRLVFSEADGFSGLVADLYAGHLVVQLNALALAACWPVLQPLFVELVQPQSIRLRSDRGIVKEEGMEAQGGVVWGTAPEGPIFVVQHGLRWGVDLAAGQKTGLYLDQVDNYSAAAKYLSGRRVLDLFCYTGGFTLTAARLGGAAEVLGIDSSVRAIATARANAELNSAHNVRFDCADGFEALDQLAGRSEKFGAVILDPPKFARKRRQVDEALRAYHRINRLAVDLLEPGGILVTCSCSGGVTRDDFLLMLSGVAQKSGRDIQVLEQRGAAPDHPVNVTCLESDYLKCFVCRVA
jgi:23S rRNA (cytosine1962-C5)-methyltransferase